VPNLKADQIVRVCNLLHCKPDDLLEYAVQDFSVDSVPSAIQTVKDLRTLADRIEGGMNVYRPADLLSLRVACNNFNK
jgi:hypothetical protein